MKKLIAITLLTLAVLNTAINARRVTEEPVDEPVLTIPVVKIVSTPGGYEIAPRIEVKLATTDEPEESSVVIAVETPAAMGGNPIVLVKPAKTKRSNNNNDGEGADNAVVVSEVVVTSTTSAFVPFGWGNINQTNMNEVGADGIIADGDGGLYYSAATGEFVDTTGYYVVVVAEGDFIATNPDGTPLNGIWTFYYTGGDESVIEPIVEELVDKQEARGPTCEVYIAADGSISSDCDASEPPATALP